VYTRFMLNENGAAEAWDWDSDMGSCVLCIHLTGYQTCTAFAHRIPPEIWNGQDRHIRPHPDDNGTLFEQRSA